MRKNTKIVGAVAVAGLVAASGSAFTNSNSVAASVAGYGSAAVTGATMTAVTHTLSGTGDSITASTLTFDAAQTGRTVVAGFGSTALQSCVVDTTTPTKATCTYGTAYVTADAASFKVAVS